MPEERIIIDDPGYDGTQSYDEIRRWFGKALAPEEGLPVIILSKVVVQVDRKILEDWFGTSGL